MRPVQILSLTGGEFVNYSVIDASGYFEVGQILAGKPGKVTGVKQFSSREAAIAFAERNFKFQSVGDGKAGVIEVFNGDGAPQGEFDMRGRYSAYAKNEPHVGLWG